MVKLRNLTLIILAVLLWGLPVGATEPVYVTLEQAEQMAFENNIDLHLANIAVAEGEMNLKQAEASSIMRPSPTTLLQAQAGLDLARQKRTMAQDNLCLSVKTDFYGVLRLEELLEIAAEGLESAERHLDVTKKKFDVGTVTQLDVIQATRRVLDSQANLSQLRHNLELAEMKFRQTLGLPLSTEIRPKAEQFSIEPLDVNLDDDLAFALKNREEIRQLEVAIAVAKKNVELADNDYTPALNLEQAKINLEKVQAQLRQVKQLLTLEITQTYLAIKDAEQRIPVLVKGVEEAEEQLRLMELMYDADMIVTNELADIQISVASAKNELVNAMYDYNLAKARYTYAVAKVLRD